MQSAANGGLSIIIITIIIIIIIRNLYSAIMTLAATEALAEQVGRIVSGKQ